MNSRVVRLVLGAVLILPVVSASAADNPPLEKVLLPIAVSGEVSGALGSRWASRLAVTNTSATAVAIDGIDAGSCNFDPCVRPTPTIQPGATIYPNLCCLTPGIPTGFLYVEEGRANDVHIELRAQDVSRQSLTWGTEIPVVHTADARSDAIHLSDVPVDPRFRLLLRVYDFDSPLTSSVRVRVYRVNPLVWNPDKGTADPFITEVPLTLSNRQLDNRIPGYAQLDLGTIQGMNGLERVRIEVIPDTAAMRFWAFVSVTNSETQHFTTITPK